MKHRYIYFCIHSLTWGSSHSLLVSKHKGACSPLSKPLPHMRGVVMGHRKLQSSILTQLSVLGLGLERNLPSFVEFVLMTAAKSVIGNCESLVLQYRE